jgi:hypothetical protein
MATEVMLSDWSVMPEENFVSEYAARPKMEEQSLEGMDIWEIASRILDIMEI